MEMLKESLERSYSVGFGWGDLEILSLIGLFIVIIAAISHFGKRLVKSENMQLLIDILIGFLASIVIIWGYMETLRYFHQIGVYFNLSINISVLMGTNKFSIVYALFDLLLPGIIYLFILVCCSVAAHCILFGKLNRCIYPILTLISVYIIAVNTFYISMLSIFLFGIAIFMINSCFLKKSKGFL